MLFVLSNKLLQSYLLWKQIDFNSGIIWNEKIKKCYPMVCVPAQSKYIVYHRHNYKGKKKEPTNTCCAEE